MPWEELLGWMAVASVAMFVGSLLLLPVVIVAMPYDYFSKPPGEGSWRSLAGGAFPVGSLGTRARFCEKIVTRSVSEGTSSMQFFPRLRFLKLRYFLFGRRPSFTVARGTAPGNRFLGRLLAEGHTQRAASAG